MAIDFRRFASLVAVLALIPFASCKRHANPGSSENENPPSPDQAGAAQPVTAETATAPESVEPAKKTVTEDEFMQAAHDGDLDKVREALAGGAKAGQPGGDGRTALMLAAFNGHTAIVRLLVEAGADVNTRDQIDRTALMYAATGPYAETVRYLLDHGAKVNIVDNNEHWTPLMFAAAEGQTSVAQLLLDAGADPTVADIDGEDALLFARHKNHAETAALIETALSKTKKTPK
jgi:ankyrin repeat protein